MPIRWVVVVNAAGDPEPAAFFCTCPACKPLSLVTAFVRRWNVEVTFEESRRQLGIETPRTMLQTFCIEFSVEIPRERLRPTPGDQWRNRRGAGAAGSHGSSFLTCQEG